MHKGMGILMKVDCDVEYTVHCSFLQNRELVGDVVKSYTLIELIKHFIFNKFSFQYSRLKAGLLICLGKFWLGASCTNNLLPSSYWSHRELETSN